MFKTATQPSIPPWSINEYQLRLESQRRVWMSGTWIFFIRPAMWSVASQVSTGCNCPFLNPYRQPNLTLSASMRCGPDVTVVTAHLQCFHRSNGDAQWQLRRRSNPAALCCSQRTDQIRSVAYCCARKTGLPLNARCVHSIDSLMKPFQLS